MNEYEKIKYDIWKLGNRDDEIKKAMKENRIDYPSKPNFLGICPRCEERVFDNELFVEGKQNIYHFSCFNYTKSEEVNE